MSAAAASPAPAESGAQAQVLDALGEIARVEHALCVQRLTVYCALGRGLATDADGASGGVAAAVNSAAEDVFGLALNDMRHLRRVNEALRLGGRPPEVGRAASVAAVSGPDVELGVLAADLLHRLLDHQDRCAAAVDALYARLRPAVEADPPVLTPELAESLPFVLDTCGDHVGPLARLRAGLEGLTPADYLRATRREPADDLERSLHQLSDRYYALVVATIGTSFAYDDELGGQLLGRAITVMDVMNEVNGLLVQRGVLPAFSAA